MPISPDHDQRVPYKKILLLVLGASFILRMLLVFSGGQFFWPDEGYRYGQSRAAVNLALAGDMRGALKTLSSADHYLFKVIGVIPAAAEAAFSPNPKIPGIFFSLFSLLNIWLLWKLCRAIGSSEAEALVAAALLAGTATFFYYSRHILPYDLGMAFGLLAVSAALREPPRYRDSFVCGMLSACTFLTYNGYWTLASFSVLAHVLPCTGQPKQFVRRAFFATVGCAVPSLAAISISAACGVNLLQQFIGFSGSILEGVFFEGWSLPIEYFWHAEHFIFLLWLGASAFCLREICAGRVTRQNAVGIGGVLYIYGSLVVFSVCLHKFVVYGRLARQCAPFFCILTAHVLERLRASGTAGRWLSRAVLAAMVVQAGYNFYEPLAQVFPSNFREAATSLTSAARQQRYELIVMDNLNYNGVLQTLGRLKPHRIVLQASDPLEYLPYQYEGYTPEEREQLRSHHIHMRLIEFLKSPAPQSR